VPEKTKRKAPRSKKPWEPPRVKTGHLFESNSLSCGKNSPGQDECLQNPTQS
jgi:hypothetical protein